MLTCVEVGGNVEVADVEVIVVGNIYVADVKDEAVR